MGRIHSGHATAMVLVVAIVATSTLHAQATDREPTAAEVAASLRTEGHDGGALAVLTQARGPKPQRQLDEIADTLVAIAATFPGDDVRGVWTRTAALSALISAGQGLGGIVGIERAVPYAGAAVRVMRLAETARDVGIRSAALTGLVQLPNRAAVLPFLRQVATSRDIVARVAVSVLSNDTGPEGRAIARELYREGTVTEPTARMALEGAAQEYGWRR